MANRQVPRRQPPRPSQKVFWLRRLFVLTVIVVFVLAIVWGVRALMTYRNAIKHQQLEAARKAAQKEQIIDPVPCDLNAIQTKVTVNKESVNAGDTASFTVELYNPSPKQPCYMQASSKIFGIAIVTGETAVYNSTACHAKDPDMKILLDAQQRYKRTFDWQASVYDSSCKAGDALKPGTYRVHSVLKGKHNDDEKAFQVVQPPPPPPEEKEGEGEESSSQ